MAVMIEHLTKRFGSFTALDDVSLTMENGIFGLLGKNGAGKTTLMRILTTLLVPTEGTVTIDGIPADLQHAREIKGKIGYLPQETGFYPDMTVQEFLEYMALLQEIPARTAKERIGELLEQVHLTEQRRKKTKHLSGGMRRRLGLAQAMLNHPAVLIVDEPTAGLDPEERVRLRNMLGQFSRNRVTILSTHIVEDAAASANRLAILDRGKVRYQGDVESLLVPLEGKIFTSVLPDENSLSLLGDVMPLSEKYALQKYVVRYYAHTRPAFACTEETATLEDAFLYLTHAKEV